MVQGANITKNLTFLYLGLQIIYIFINFISQKMHDGVYFPLFYYLCALNI